MICKMSSSTISPSARGGQKGVFDLLISIFCKLLINNVLRWVLQKKFEWHSDECIPQMKCIGSKITKITWWGKMWYVKCRLAQYPLLKEGAKGESLIRQFQFFANYWLTMFCNGLYRKNLNETPMIIFSKWNAFVPKSQI